MLVPACDHDLSPYHPFHSASLHASFVSRNPSCRLFLGILSLYALGIPVAVGHGWHASAHWPFGAWGSAVIYGLSERGISTAALGRSVIAVQEGH